MNARALVIASLVGTVLQVAMVVAGHYNKSITNLFAVGGMGFSLVAGAVYVLLAKESAMSSALLGGLVAGGICAFLGILVSYLLRDVPASLLALGTISSLVTGAIGAALARWLGRAMGLAITVPLVLFAVPKSHAQPRASDFAPLEFLVGSCWIGTFPDGKATDEHCFEWVFDQKFIRDRHIVRGPAKPYEGESLYRIDDATRRISYWYWSNAGLVVTGYLEPQGKDLVFPSRYGVAPNETEIKAVWTRTGPDSFHVTQSQKTGDTWNEIMTMDLHRKAGR